MCLAFLITKATDAHSEYVILITFSRQQWLRERASLLRYTYIACLVCIVGNYVSMVLHIMPSLLWYTQLTVLRSNVSVLNEHAVYQ